MGLFANDRELQAYWRRCGETDFLGVVRAKRGKRGARGKRQDQELAGGAGLGVPASPGSTASEMSTPIEELLAVGMDGVGVESEE